MGKLIISGLLLIIISYLSTVTRGWGVSPSENIAKLHFYVNYIETGPSPTVYASITSQSPSNFGRIIVEDIPMRAGPSVDSEQLGRAQGLFTYAGLEARSGLLSHVFVFQSGPYSGSSINVVGRLALSGDYLAQESEFPIVGGTGAFRFARGYGILTTYSSNGLMQDAVLEITLYTTYYVDDSVAR